ncbi:SDR family oxidoreductase [Roseibium sp. RKSG952]|uniref:SDR family NAD(P)-dependent oxidoreductase n=1 Tax=Roseibium sp. RKSG952 TaxID=2529384 RepID=UPI0012BD0215|nr:SDR family NAD(P)-dependent oxidoreductase [Roseibium sp. RKSG952]MTH98914.1 SDR family NAD(P)-dependent oxidoreductase [Roseibium sp. RKSG952]
MARFDPQTIVLTGASGGIGEELAKELAGPGRRFLLIARDRDKLAALAVRLEAQGASAEIAALDVRDKVALTDSLSAFDRKHPVDLVIANAGVTAGLGADRSREAEHEVERQIDINYRAAVNTVSGLAEAMRVRGRGQVVLVASLAGLRPLPDMPTYSATKAALIAYGHALRGWLKPFGVGVTILCPGFVTTPMSIRHNGAKPFEISADKAARLMYKAIMKRKALYAFPFPLAFGIYLQNLLPPRLADLFVGGFGAEIEKDPRYEHEGGMRE